jgi:SEFIR domain-containing protein
MKKEIIKNPKLFISYSWGSSDHEQWVLRLAEDLVENGVDVIVDKWNLREGQDAIEFMEKMVTDPEIKKVVIISDKKYAEKSDKRKGGVGTEAQIISKEIYDKVDQNKFVLVLKERDANGEPFLPTYYKSRIFIDLSENEIYAKNYDQLLRWIFDEPLHKKPSIGKKPEFLSNDSSINISTSTIFRRVVDSIKNGKSYAEGATTEYFNTFIHELKKFEIIEYEGEFDDKVIENIEQFVPYRNEIIQIILTINSYNASFKYIEIIHKFFEKLIPFLYPKESLQYSNYSKNDNLKFIIHELFLYVIASLIKNERFDDLTYLLNTNYYSEHLNDYGSSLLFTFSIIRPYLRSLEVRNKRLNLRRISLHADLLHERCSGSGFTENELMQADFILYLKDVINSVNDISELKWYPYALLYIVNRSGRFEAFLRSESEGYFKRFMKVFGIKSKNELEKVINFFKTTDQIPKFDYHTLNPIFYMNYENLATKP